MAQTDDTRDIEQIVVLDTNVLLADPNSVLSFPRAEVVIPETVLGELDKLKTARVDPDLRFRGREVSRLLFELSEEGSLVGGVELPDGGRLRVAPLDSDVELPEGLSTRNADDKIIGTVYSVCKTASKGCDVTLVTNDLNMLLKAQTLGITVSRYGEGVEGGFAKKYIIRPFQRYKVPLGILAVALGVFAAVVVLLIVNGGLRPSGANAGVPTEFQDLLSQSQQKALQALITLDGDPKDSTALLAMANFYSDAATNAQQSGDRAAVLNMSRGGIRYYERYLALRTTDNDARADLASLLFYSGQTDKAIQEVGTVLQDDPNHVNANYNLGIIYWQGRHDLKAATDQMNKVIKLTQNDSQQHSTLQLAQLVLTQIEAEKNGTGSAGATETTGSTIQ
ncbi:MAG TPA: PIN domain-containing protein [Coriobacteriia bacterium]|nr:PIN domain-containing protein [Coriobacteriia bacterium]